MYLAGLPVDARARRDVAARLHGLAGEGLDGSPAGGPAGPGRIRARCAGWYLLTLPERENTHIAYLDPLVAPALPAARYRDRGWSGTRRRRAHRRGPPGAGGRGEGGRSRPRRSGGRSAALRASPRRPGCSAWTPSRRGGWPLLGHGRSRRRGATRCVSWEGQIPEEHHAAVAALNQAMGDAPRDEGQEEQRWDEARVRVAAAGRRARAALLHGGRPLRAHRRTRRDDPGWASTRSRHAGPSRR